MSAFQGLTDRTDSGGYQKFVKEELGRLSRHFLGFIWISKCTEECDSYLSELRTIVVDRQGGGLVTSDLFNSFLVSSKEVLKRSWNEYTNTNLKVIYNLFANKNPRLCGGALDNIDTYYQTIPHIGPQRIGGPNDDKFSSLFSMKSM
jgi:hypothetical protein